MGKVHTLRWEVHIKYKERLIKREFLMAVPHLKGGGNVLYLCEG